MAPSDRSTGEPGLPGGIPGGVPGGVPGGGASVRPELLPRAALDLLDRAWVELAGAQGSPESGERYVRAHLAALRAAACVIAARGRPRLRGRQALNVWNGLAAVAPEMQEWAQVFSACAARRAAVETGREPAVSAREADDHLVRAGEFTVAVARLLGLPEHVTPQLLAAG